MKKPTLKVSWVVFATAAIAVGSASAARADEPIVTNAKVPFAFIVGDVRLPAGDYVVQEMADGSPVVAIVSADGQKAALTLTIRWSSSGEAAAQPELLFEKFGGEYFLARAGACDLWPTFSICFTTAGRSSKQPLSMLSRVLSS